MRCTASVGNITWKEQHQLDKLWWHYYYALRIIQTDECELNSRGSDRGMTISTSTEFKVHCLWSSWVTWILKSELCGLQLPSNTLLSDLLPQNLLKSREQNHHWSNWIDRHARIAPSMGVPNLKIYVLYNQVKYDTATLGNDGERVCRSLISFSQTTHSLDKQMSSNILK